MDGFWTSSTVLFWRQYGFAGRDNVLAADRLIFRANFNTGGINEIVAGRRIHVPLVTVLLAKVYPHNRKAAFLYNWFWSTKILMRGNNYRLASYFPPFQQGGLDSLCGLYSIVNAERFINQSSDEEAQQLFDDVIHTLARRRLLADMLSGGIIHTQMLMILKRVVGKKRISKVEVPWRGVPNPDLTSFWKSMQYFLDGTQGRAIILGLNGFHDHWTVIESITNRSIYLYDSAQIKKLSRSSCTTVYATGRRKHLLLPAQTYFLSNNMGEISQYDQ